ncbi:MAG: rRNA maturation RNase YbeY [Clostridia bacterium]|nr:rRNA maturation RNase YbeY [Clostridia bacterium]
MNKLVEINYHEIEQNNQYENIIEQVLTKCFQEENMDKLGLYVSVTLTCPSYIRKINNEHRKIDKETDVLSFPMFEKEEIDKLISTQNNIVNDILGDIIVSIERVKQQATEYEHSFERELSYMIVHGFYHLIGYDHMNDEEKSIMRAKEENILNKLKITRQ